MKNTPSKDHVVELNNIDNRKCESSNHKLSSITNEINRLRQILTNPTITTPRPKKRCRLIISETEERDENINEVIKSHQKMNNHSILDTGKLRSRLKRSQPLGTPTRHSVGIRKQQTGNPSFKLSELHLGGDLNQSSISLLSCGDKIVTPKAIHHHTASPVINSLSSLISNSRASLNSSDSPPLIEHNIKYSKSIDSSGSSLCLPVNLELLPFLDHHPKGITQQAYNSIADTIGWFEIKEYSHFITESPDYEHVEGIDFPVYKIIGLQKWNTNCYIVTLTSQDKSKDDYGLNSSFSVMLIDPLGTTELCANQMIILAEPFYNLYQNSSKVAGIRVYLKWKCFNLNK